MCLVTSASSVTNGGQSALDQAMAATLAAIDTTPPVIPAMPTIKGLLYVI